MKMNLIIPISLITLLSACSETQVKAPVNNTLSKPVKTQYIPEQKPELSTMNMSGALNYGYKIYGDPVAAPVQVFSDSRYMYLQLAKGQVPPIPVTRDGKIVEYDVKRGFMVIPKVDSVVLRLGPRKAYIDKKNVEIVRYNNSEEATKVPARLNVEVSSPVNHLKNKIIKKTRFLLSLNKVLKSSSLSDLDLPNHAPGQWRICTYPNAITFNSGLKLKLELEKKDWSVNFNGNCRAEKEQIILEKVK